MPLRITGLVSLDLGCLKPGQIVRVTTNKAADVRIARPFGKTGQLHTWLQIHEDGTPALPAYYLVPKLTSYKALIMSRANEVRENLSVEVF